MGQEVTPQRALVIAAAFLARGCESTNPYYDPTKPHHRPGGFQNVEPAAHMPRTLGDFLRWQRERFDLEIAPPTMDLSVVPAELDAIQSNRKRFAVTWVGHATALVQLGGINVLTDPHFSERASPVQWLGPRRWQA
ncbi:MAG: MBL fold metallo-hydrolase, partial [Gammaproteobacteria bacterium]